MVIDMRKLKNNMNTKPQRINKDFEKEMKDLAKFRYMKNLEKKEPSFPEMTDLVRRTQAWNQVKFELQTKKRKEDLI